MLGVHSSGLSQVRCRELRQSLVEPQVGFLQEDRTPSLAVKSDTRHYAEFQTSQHTTDYAASTGAPTQAGGRSGAGSAGRERKGGEETAPRKRAERTRGEGGTARASSLGRSHGESQTKARDWRRAHQGDKCNSREPTPDIVQRIQREQPGLRQGD